MKPIDIFITTYLRQMYTQQTIEYLEKRTKYPYRLFVIDNGGNKEVLDEAVKQKKIFLTITPSSNMGIHAAWDISLALAESDYFITSDNDIYVPDLFVANEGYPVVPHYEPCWLERMVKFMDERPDYGAISLHPHIFIGAAGIDPNDPDDVKERNMCGAVMRIMRREAVWEAGGWEKVIRTGRNHEERTICSRLQTAGYKVGIASRIRAYHPFGKEAQGNWGYPPEFTPEMQGHNPALAEEVLRFDNIDAYDNRTWLPK
ncbi:MAG TPA: glycosyltransferase [bacterium]|nr:glycosyltransferase [bacterium]